MGRHRSEARWLGGRYRLVEPIGSGGMSVVWRGYDEVLGRQVAVKVLAPRLAGDRALRQRIRIEAQAAARLTHPHITNVYDYGEFLPDGRSPFPQPAPGAVRGVVPSSIDGPIPYVVMELVDGESLGDRLRRTGSLPWREAVAVSAEVASALASAHARGIVHRDVTPGNVMLTAAGVKVVDFGISALVGEDEGVVDGTLLGTPAYLAPERLDDGQVTAATDVYALGLLLYRTLTGALPWKAGSTTEMLRAHRYTDPTPMPGVDGLPDEVRDVVHRCLAKAPGDRPSSAEAAKVLAEAAGMLTPVPAVVALAGAGDEPVALAGAGTTLLPWSTGTAALPGSRSVRRAEHRRQRFQTVAAGAGMVAVTGAMWAVTAWTPASGGTPAPAAAATPTEPCQVGYALRTDSGGAFAAEVTLTNTGEQPLKSWDLSFTLPGDQTITGGAGIDWRQQGRTVSLRPTDGMGLVTPGGSQKLAVTGRYAGSNPLPVEFQVDGRRCGVRVLGLAGAAPVTSSPTARASTGGGASATVKRERAPKPPKRHKGEKKDDKPRHSRHGHKK